MQRHPGVAPVELRSLDQPLGPADRIGGKPHQQIRRLQQVEIAAYRRLREGDIAAKLRLVHQVSRAEAGGTHEPAEVGQRRDRGEALEVPLQVGAHVAVEPDGPLPIRPKMESRQGEPSATGKRTPVLGLIQLRSHQIEPLLIGGIQQLFPDAPEPEAPLLPPGHRPQRQVARPARKRLGHLAHQEQIGRTGEEELPRPAVPVYVSLHLVEKIGLTLDPHR